MLSVKIILIIYYFQILSIYYLLPQKCIFEFNENILSKNKIIKGPIKINLSVK